MSLGIEAHSRSKKALPLCPHLEGSTGEEQGGASSRNDTPPSLLRHHICLPVLTATPPHALSTAVPILQTGTLRHRASWHGPGGTSLRPCQVAMRRGGGKCRDTCSCPWVPGHNSVLLGQDPTPQDPLVSDPACFSMEEGAQVARPCTSGELTLQPPPLCPVSVHCVGGPMSPIF